MLLAKSCHDLDWIRFLMGRRCLKVSSFGSLKHFRAEERPAGAADRCVDCALVSSCPYSAVTIYLGRLRAGRSGWPVSVVTPEPTEESVLEALRTGPYGRCVYGCDNDVVDHQVVAMEFEGGRTAAFTMTAFTEQRDRQLRIFGTRGEISGDGAVVDLYDFATDRHTRVDTRGGDAGALAGHGGGDYHLMRAFVGALASGDRSRVLSGPQESLETHLMVFAAERARREERVVQLQVM
jgi:predicted dehydrogenase